MEGDSSYLNCRLKKNTTWRKLGGKVYISSVFRQVEFEDPLGLHVANSFIFEYRAQEKIQSKRCSFGLPGMHVEIKIIGMHESAGKREWSRTRNLGIKLLGK